MVLHPHPRRWNVPLVGIPLPGGAPCGPPNSWKERKNYTSEIFLLLWALLIFLFFSASSSKLIPYLLPVLPPLALLIGKYLADGWERNALWGFGAGRIAYSVITAALAIGLFIVSSVRAGAQHLRHDRRLLDRRRWLLMGCIAVWTSRGRDTVNRVVIHIVLAFLVFFIAGSAIAPQLDTRSLKPFARVLKPILRPVTR